LGGWEHGDGSIGRGSMGVVALEGGALGGGSMRVVAWEGGASGGWEHWGW